MRRHKDEDGREHDARNATTTTTSRTISEQIYANNSRMHRHIYSSASSLHTLYSEFVKSTERTASSTTDVETSTQRGLKDKEIGIQEGDCD
ncbi:unnamed protein product [Ceratitis capitata]|uniref:(Mediterranean fruit fly) hypothetical protein n=1 Tax=Ceratitis capitata TaxID=7213 RepID=A0A811VKL1_CERCA|nr:unnamed protein product [Ceratitis capitata]